MSHPEPELLAGLLPPDVLVAARHLSADDEPRFRFAEEAAHVAGAIHKRQLEFAVGRELAHQLLDTCRPDAPSPLLVGPRREPLWPAGCNGSITHTKGLCVVAVSAHRRFLGIDVEVTEPLDEKLWPSVLTVSERARLKGIGARGALLSKVHFSAKEAVYKAIAQTVGRVVDFAEVEIGVSLARGTFDVRPALKDGAELPTLSGQWRVTRAFIATAVVASPAEDRVSG